MEIKQENLGRIKKMLSEGLKQKDVARIMRVSQSLVSYIQNNMATSKHFKYLAVLRNTGADINKIFDTYLELSNMNITTEVFHNDTAHEYLVLADFYEHFLRNLPETFLIHGTQNAEKMILDHYTQTFQEMGAEVNAITLKEKLIAPFLSTYYNIVRERLEELSPERFEEINVMSPIDQHNKYAEIAQWVYNTMTPQNRRNELYVQPYEDGHSDHEEDSINNSIFTYFLNNH